MSLTSEFSWERLIGIDAFRSRNWASVPEAFIRDKWNLSDCVNSAHLYNQHVVIMFICEGYLVQRKFSFTLPHSSRLTTITFQFYFVWTSVRNEEKWFYDTYMVCNLVDWAMLYLSPLDLTSMFPSDSDIDPLSSHMIYRIGTSSKPFTTASWRPKSNCSNDHAFQFIDLKYLWANSFHWGMLSLQPR